VSKKDIIESAALFNGLGDEQLEKIIGIAKVRIFPPGSVIIEEGSNGNSMMIISRGAVDVVQKVAGDEGNIKLATLGKGQIFGEMALIDIEPRSATVIANEETEIVEISQEEVNELLTSGEGLDYIPILVNIARGMSGKLRKANLSLAEISNVLKRYYYSH
jgi:CRP/FNR family transcriptional regulator/CRP/FNR family cyclic AMP-dependent transcriptional regulator